MRKSDYVIEGTSYWHQIAAWVAKRGEGARRLRLIKSQLLLRFGNKVYDNYTARVFPVVFQRPK